MKDRVMRLKCVGLLLFAGVSSHLQAAPPTTVPNVDLNAYMGTWYEMARFPMFFQRQCARDVTATYTLQSNQTVHVDNQCLKTNGERVQALGEAYAIDATNSRLKVTFLPQWLRTLPIGRGDYWILRFDTGAVLVGSPNREYLWILSRHPQLDEKIYQSFVETAREQGFNVQQLQRTQQTTAQKEVQP
jgi:apolipoprotein D and lipocalin family protein